MSRTNTNTGGSLPENAPRWIVVTKTFADFAAAATTNNIEIYSQAANEVIHAVIEKHSVSFTGGAIAAYTISAGYVGALTTLTGNSALNVFQAPSNTAYVESNNSGPVIKSFSGATSVRGAAISTGANLNAATQGTVAFHLLVSTLA